MMQFWEPIWSGFVVTKDGEEAKALTLSGYVDVINMALQSIQYLGYLVSINIMIHAYFLSTMLPIYSVCCFQMVLIV